MKVLIAGGSASGIIAAILLKKSRPHAEVAIFDKEEKLAKKIYATGNGHCNIASANLEPKAYNRPEFVQKAIESGGISEITAFYESIGLPLKKQSDLYYPLSYSASAAVAVLEANLRKAGAEIHLGERILDYAAGKEATLKTDKGIHLGDYLIFAIGGKSSPNLGSDGSLFKVFEKHGYKIEEPRPGLTAAKTTGDTKKASGCRHRCVLRAMKGQEEIFREDGEVLFRDDGLSGICVFNAVSVIERRKDDRKGYSLVADLFPEYTVESLAPLIQSTGSIGLASIIEPKLANWIQARVGKNATAFDIARFLKKAEFGYIAPSGYEHSQVTIGGVSLDDLDGNLRSKIEKNVSFAGEAVDVDGLCGGYNLSWAYLSASLAVKGIAYK